MWYILHSTIALALVLSAFAFMFSKLFRIAAFINMGAHEEQHTDHKTARWKMVAQIVFGHKKTLEDPISGLTHIAFIYGFLILGAGPSTIRLSPPLIIDEEQADFAAGILSDAISSVLSSAASIRPPVRDSGS